MSQRHGFTLFEIVISLLLLTIGVLTTLALMPAGIKSQQQARFAAYASAKVMDMMEMFNCQVPADYNIDGELANPWETTAGSRVMTYDLEARLVTTRAGLLPLPTTIANRLDSAGDEIAKLLATGGRIYYSQPVATLDQAIYQNPRSTSTIRVATSITEARRMLVGVVGHAQQNSIPVLPWKSWPYYHGYPAPPLEDGSYQTASPVAKTVDDNRNAEVWLFEMYKTYRKRLTGDYNPVPPAIMPWNDPPTLSGCLDYVALAMWYAELRGLPAPFRDGTATGADVDLVANYGNADYVRALSHLAHATTCLTKWCGLSNREGTNDGSDPLIVGLARNLVTGFVIPARKVTVVGSTTRSPTSTPPTRDISIDLVKIKNWHQLSLDMIMKHAAHYPYNWGAPRPFNRAIMMDVPLLEWDLFPDQSSTDFPLLTGAIKSSGGVAAGNVTAWHYRALAPMAITSQGVQTPNPDLRTSDIGKAITFKDETRLASTIFGNINHYTLARPFDPSERCRELVFWMADWQSYEDFETAPSAPVDASKYPFRAEGFPFGMRMSVGDGLLNPDAQSSYMNPERNLILHADVSAQPTGQDITSLRFWGTFVASSNIGGGAPSVPWDQGSLPFHDSTGGVQTERRLHDAASPAPAVFSGLFGADRNANGVLDRGPLPTSVRQRAVTVARFVVYDPRLPLTMR